MWKQESVKGLSSGLLQYCIRDDGWDALSREMEPEWVKWSGVRKRTVDGKSSTVSCGTSMASYLEGNLSAWKGLAPSLLRGGGVDEKVMYGCSSKIYLSGSYLS